ncbi:class I SAM-dependent methyltransferase [Sporosarcina sp. Marseille-Q4063]|uniref:class I SAM-dependent methyltransferase n=1 Tax=Sporosarcina sp. Marseille-Q4063 TaxID=2810514 RepID=UPI001BAE8C47|nr:class I SAM-dependent methyltransferase [Sporosarcina sp. Marseille-Q4063]QUW20386.1 class I SAM-dependent methyltransferase [Sporosarcina sp. Marseille-Q4063]
MSEHYYSKDPTVKSQPKELFVTLRQRSFRFVTDAGVFSKGDVDFGSRLLAESFVMPEVEGDVLDVGCGYGPIGLSIAASFPERKIHMVDVNERALSLSAKNAENNSISNIEIYPSDALDDVATTGFSAILTNPPIRAGKKTVFSFYDGAFSKLKTGGELWVVIQKKQGAPSTIQHLEKLFGNAEIIVKKKGYHIIRAIKV